MKKSEKKSLGRNILNSVLSFAKHATVANPVVSMAIGAGEGVVKSVQGIKDKNIASEVGGEGQVDYAGLIGAVGGFIIVIGGGIALMKGWITIDDLKELLKIWEDTQ
jgi:hypothetical protein